MNETGELLTLAKDVVRAAAAALAAERGDTREILGVELGGRETKLAADRMLEARLLAGLATSGLPVLTEESGAVGDLAERFCWVVDPLDGSVNYLRGSGPSAISVALCDNGRPVIGVLQSIGSGRMSWGGPGLGAWTEGEPIAVSRIEDAERGILCTGFPARFDTRDGAALAGFAAGIARFAKIRMLGSAASSLLMVARGEADAYYEDHIMLWDVAAGAALVMGAGGHVTLTGGGLDQPYRVVATNARVTIGAGDWPAA
jgi:myo-inositol-1(or 4)-monophosphatase